MITEIVLFRLPKDMSRKEAMDKYRATIPIWQGKPGLIRKTFLYDEASQRGGAVYLWNNIESAKEAHGRVIQERIRSWWGADPEFQYFETPIVLDNAANKVIDAADTPARAEEGWVAQKRHAEVLGRRMAYVERGEGRPVMLLHGNPASSYLWRNVLSHLVGRGRLIAPDLMGMGDSDKLPPSEPDRYRFAGHARYLESFLELIE